MIAHIQITMMILLNLLLIGTFIVSCALSFVLHKEELRQRAFAYAVISILALTLFNLFAQMILSNSRLWT